MVIVLYYLNAYIRIPRAPESCGRMARLARASVYGFYTSQRSTQVSPTTQRYVRGYMHTILPGVDIRVLSVCHACSATLIESEYKQSSALITATVLLHRRV